MIRSITLLCALLSVSFAFDRSPDALEAKKILEDSSLIESEFDAHLARFPLDGKTKLDKSERSKRLDLFRKKLKEIAVHDVKRSGYEKGLNKFTLLTKEEFKRQAHGHKPAANQWLHSQAAYGATNPADPNNGVSPLTELYPVSDLPTAVDWRQQGVVSAVKDQLRCGSCWAYATAAVVESATAIATGQLFSLSTEQILDCVDNVNSCGGTGGCSGGTAEVALNYFGTNSSGFFETDSYYYTQGNITVNPTETPTPYSESKCKDTVWYNETNTKYNKATVTGYYKLLSNNYTDLMNHVARVGPVAISVDATNFHDYQRGIFPQGQGGCNGDSTDINHAVTLVGYGVDEESGKKYYLIRNSWSPSWGEGGYMRMERTDQDGENCQLDTTPLDGWDCQASNPNNNPKPVCGPCGILVDSVIPTGATSGISNGYGAVYDSAVDSTFCSSNSDDDDDESKGETIGLSVATGFFAVTTALLLGMMFMGKTVFPGRSKGLNDAPSSSVV